MLNNAGKESRFIDGKLISSEILERLKLERQSMNKDLSLEVFWVGNDKATESFVKIKSSFAEKIGINFILRHFDEISEKELLEQIEKSKADALLLQLPLTENIDKNKAIESIKIQQDLDVLKRETYNIFKNASLSELDTILLPPVAGAVYEIIKKYKIESKGKKAVVLGNGMLVGKPVFELLKKYDFAELAVFDLNSDPQELKRALFEADLLVSGTGSPSLVKAEMIKDGAVLIDAGTSSQKARNGLLGDIDLNCRQKASLFARTPGGVGPITVAVLYQNLIKLAKNRQLR